MEQTRIGSHLIFGLVTLIFGAITTVIFFASWPSIRATIAFEPAPIEATWKTYSEPLFSIEFPVNPTTFIYASQEASDRGFQNDEQYSSQYGTDLFFVEAAEFLPSSDLTAESVLEDSRNGLSSLLGIKVAISKVEDFKGNRSFRLDYEDVESGQFIKTLFIFWDGSKHGIPNRYFSLARLSPKGFEDNGDYDRFINSLKIKHQ
jgi:hypothetical protein